MQRLNKNQFCTPFHYKLPFYTKSTAQARVGPKLVEFLHPSAESCHGRLSGDSLSPEFRSLALLYVHADHFINDCAYGSIRYVMCIIIFYVYILLNKSLARINIRFIYI